MCAVLELGLLSGACARASVCIRVGVCLYVRISGCGFAFVFVFVLVFVFVVVFVLLLLFLFVLGCSQKCVCVPPFVWCAPRKTCGCHVFVWWAPRTNIWFVWFGGFLAKCDYLLFIGWVPRKKNVINNFLFGGSSNQCDCVFLFVFVFVFVLVGGLCFRLSACSCLRLCRLCFRHCLCVWSNSN